MSYNHSSSRSIVLKFLFENRHYLFANAIDFSDKIPFLIEETHVMDDGSLDQTVPNLSTPPHSSPNSGLERIERFSRKVFVGGLPPDIDEGKVCGWTGITVFMTRDS